MTDSLQEFQLVVSVVVYDTQIEELESWYAAVLTALRHSQGLLDIGKPSLILIINNGEDSLSRFYESCRSRCEHANVNCEVRLIEGHGNVGYGAAHNFSLNYSSTGYHVFMNADVEVHPSAFAEGLQYLESNRGVIAVSPACWDFDGSKQYLCKRYPSVLDLALRGFSPPAISRLFESRLSRYEMRELDSDSNCDVPIISGCFLMCRREAFESVSGFDSRYFLYFEDFDISLRLGKIGKLAYVPSIKIRHRGGKAASKGLRHVGMFIQSAITFFSTHGWKWV